MIQGRTDAPRHSGAALDTVRYGHNAPVPAMASSTPARELVTTQTEFGLANIVAIRPAEVTAPSRWVTQAEHDAIAKVLTGCAGTAPYTRSRASTGLSTLGPAPNPHFDPASVARSIKANSAPLPGQQRSRQPVSGWCAAWRRTVGTSGLRDCKQVRGPTLQHLPSNAVRRPVRFSLRWQLLTTAGYSRRTPA
jgi:hypothetical protein